MKFNLLNSKKISSFYTKSVVLLSLLLGMFLTVSISTVNAATDNATKTVMYVEVNNQDFNNVAKYSLEGTNKSAFDIGIIFAANINYDSVNKKAYLHLNERVTETLDNAESQIRPVQARGTKVLLSILGNHQGAGFANFTSYASADAFAAELADVVERFNLDGIDFDDECAEYGVNGTSHPNNQSFIWLVQALRNRLGSDKLITLYNIGPAAYNSASNPNLNPLINYAWNPYYGTWSVPNISGMGVSKLGPAAVEVGTNKTNAKNLARRTKQGNYGVFVMYNLSSANSSDFISVVTRELYGVKTTYTK